MGISLGGRRGGISEINVVPLIEILLVLLVIFMVIRVHTQGLEAQIPQPGPAGPQPAEVVVVEILADGSLVINQEPATEQDLGGRLEQILGSTANRAVFIRGSGSVDFEVVASVISKMHSSGVESVGLLTPGLEKAAGF